MLVSFWSPYKGYGGVSSSMMSIGSYLSIDYQLNILMSSVRAGSRTLEKGFEYFRAVEGVEESRGIDSLERLVYSGLLSPEKVRDSAMSVIKERLDILDAPYKMGEEKLLEALPIILDQAVNQYGMVFMDLNPGLDSVTENILGISDLVVINLTQDLEVLEKSLKICKSVLKDKKVLFVLSRYDNNAVISKDKIISKFGLKRSEVGVVPYNVKVLDGINKGNILDFIIRSSGVKKKGMEFNDTVFFSQSVREMGKKILSSLSLNPPKEVDSN